MGLISGLKTPASDGIGVKRWSYFLLHFTVIFRQLEIIAYCVIDVVVMQQRGVMQ
jgi:hypothetical protein